MQFTVSRVVLLVVFLSLVSACATSGEGTGYDPGAGTSNSCPLEGTWTFDYERTEADLKAAYSHLYSDPLWDAMPKREGKSVEPPDPFEVTMALVQYRTLIDAEWSFSCDTETMSVINPSNNVLEIVKQSRYSWRTGPDNSVVVDAIDGDGDPTRWSVEILNDGCFEWTQPGTVHNVFWCPLR